MFLGRVWITAHPLGVGDLNELRQLSLSRWNVPGVVAIGLGELCRHLGDVRVKVLRLAVLVGFDFVIVHHVGRLV